jgi:hypothetical protein
MLERLFEMKEVTLAGSIRFHQIIVHEYIYFRSILKLRFIIINTD